MLVTYKLSGCHPRTVTLNTEICYFRQSIGTSMELSHIFVCRQTYARVLSSQLVKISFKYLGGEQHHLQVSPAMDAEGLIIGHLGKCRDQN